LDFMQKPGEGETLMVTFEAMTSSPIRTVDRSYFNDGRADAKKTVRVPFSLQA
jgi:hypothetical protein